MAGTAADLADPQRPLFELTHDLPPALPAPWVELDLEPGQPARVYSHPEQFTGRVEAPEVTLELLAEGKPPFTHGGGNRPHAAPTAARSRTAATIASVSGT